VSELRFEYLDGEIFAMAGGAPEHGILAAALIRMLGNALPKNCHVLTSDAKDRTELERKPETRTNAPLKHQPLGTRRNSEHEARFEKDVTREKNLRGDTGQEDMGNLALCGH
jgi:hypothetical protein